MRLASIVTAFAYVLLGVCACDPAHDSQRAVRARAADDVHGERRLGGIGTASYPRVQLAGQSRVVCTDATPDATTRKLLTWTIELPRSSRIEFSWGIDASKDFASVIEISATLTTATRTTEIYSATVDGAARDYGYWKDVAIDVETEPGTATVEIVATSSLPWSVGENGRQARVHLGCPTVTAVSTNPRRRNLLIVSLDTLRADRLGIYGYDRPTSPVIDRIFSNEGAYIERVVASATKTLHSHATMLTGLEPQTAVKPWKDVRWARLAGLPTLADVLLAQGYRTAAVTESGYLSDRAFGFGQGFETFDERTGVQENVHNEGTIEETFHKGIEWVARHREEPFFLFLHSYQVHSPYRPLGRFRERFPATITESIQSLESGLYDAEIAHADEAVGELLSALAELDVLDDTLVVITSDHGEEFGEHGGRYHGQHLQPEVLDVPLLLRAPGLLHAGTRISGTMGLVDLAPTVLELLEVQPPAYMQGTSYASALRAGRAIDPGTIFSVAVIEKAETYGADDPTWISPSVAVTRWPDRLIRISTPLGPRYELYDLATDPRALDDLLDPATRLPARLEALREQLDALVERADEPADALYAELGGDGRAAPGRDGSRPDDRQLEQLRRLGYID